jgi:soluble lytic murein transglycosylase-like protein/TolA-binding protein
VTHLVHVWLWLASITVAHPGTPLVRSAVLAAADSVDPASSLDSALSYADEALARGRPWQATRLIAPWLIDSTKRTPAVIFLAARAASEWRGWSEVVGLLGSESWLDTLYGGSARVLLARAALERHQDSLALEHATLALRRRPSSGERQLLLATALDRLGARDSAATVYQHAAAQLPALGDWLLLRAAAVTDDSAARAELYGRITNLTTRGRIPWAEAAAHENVGDLVGAARRYTATGDRLAGLRLRLAATPDSAPRAALRREFLALVAGRASAGAVREAVAILDSVFAPFAPSEDLTLARAAMTSGLAARAATGFARAGQAALGSSEDRFAYGNVLTRLNRNAEAAVQFKLVRKPQSLAALAAYQAARALVRDGQIERGRAELVAVTRKYPGDTTAAASALFLRADLASDDRGDEEARRLHRVVASRYPTSRFAPTSRFRAAMVALLDHQPELAAREFDAIVERYPASDEAVSATYWAGRAWADAGDSTLARGRWQTVADQDPLSYYAALSARRLGVAAWVPPQAADTFQADSVLETEVARAALLARLGLAAESRWELEHLARSSDSSPERLLVVANAFRSQGMASQAIQIARRALAHGAPADARTYRLLFPVVHEDALFAEAAEHRLDPSFMAALIRQESSFNASATSPAGARGLAQVMPELGERLARELEYPLWDPVLLYQPDVSIQLGAVHLGELFGRYEQPAHILAAYNAGASRVERWSKRIGVDDPEVFAERISFVETRDYVRIIQRNEDIYRALYGAELNRLLEVAPPLAPDDQALSGIPQM